MTKIQWILCFVFGTATLQTGTQILSATVPYNWVQIGAGVLVAVGTTFLALLKELPRQEWSVAKRDAAQEVVDAKAVVAAVKLDEKKIAEAK